MSKHDSIVERPLKRNRKEPIKERNIKKVSREEDMKRREKDRQTDLKKNHVKRESGVREMNGSSARVRS